MTPARRTVLAGIIGAIWLISSNAHAAAQLQTISAEELRAKLDKHTGQVVLLNFWATWCRPCLDEIPVLMRLQDQYHDQGFSLIAVSLDDIESSDSAVAPFMQQWFPNFSSYIGAVYEMDDMVAAVDTGWNEVLPTSYLFARDGSLKERLQGQYSAEEFSQKIQALLEQKLSAAD